VKTVWASLVLISALLNAVPQNLEPDEWQQGMRLAQQHQRAGRMKDAEGTLRRLLAEAEAADPQPVWVAAVWNNLGHVYQDLGQVEKALQCYQHSVRLWEKHTGGADPALIQPLNNLATLYAEQGRYAEAEALHERSLEIRIRHYGRNHTRVAIGLSNMAELLNRRGNSRRAEQLLREALAIWEAHPGAEPLAEGAALNNLAISTKDRREAEELLLRANQLLASAAPGGVERIRTLTNLGLLYARAGRLNQAEPALRQALEIAEWVWGPDHPELGGMLQDYARVLKRLGRNDEAMQASVRSRQILNTVLPRRMSDYVIHHEDLRRETERR
jgi:tetratricopeptide (TPR) repeat protein